MTTVDSSMRQLLVVCHRPFSPFFLALCRFSFMFGLPQAPVWPDAFPVSGPRVGVKGDLEGPVPQGLDVPSYPKALTLWP